MAHLRAEAEQSWVFGEADDVRLVRSTRIIWIFAALLGTALLWAYFARLDEVSTGSGRVVPTMREQVIQSLEGGILAELHVRQDDIVEPGQILAKLDPTQTESNVEESAARYRAALASSARLEAEVNQTPLAFPDELNNYPDLMVAETELYEARQQSLEESLQWISESIELVRSELEINESLTDVGAASNVEVIRLKRQLVDLQLKQVEVRSQYIVQAREELAKANAEVEALSSVVRGRADSLTRLTLRSPVRGIVKNIEVSTINGVIPPNGKLMDIVPLDDQLLIEARISPRDIAFIHPGQRASVKITAYDYAIYGGLEGSVTSISADGGPDVGSPHFLCPNELVSLWSLPAFGQDIAGSCVALRSGELDKLESSYSYGAFRVFWTEQASESGADHRLPAQSSADANNSGIPDYIENIARQAEAARQAFISLGFPDPLDSPKYRAVRGFVATADLKRKGGRSEANYAARIANCSARDGFGLKAYLACRLRIM